VRAERRSSFGGQGKRLKLKWSSNNSLYIQAKLANNVVVVIMSVCDVAVAVVAAD
jgi:hypothetical protein